MDHATAPTSTYRIQFNPNFRFVDASDLVPYLHDLGIGDLYASPRFKARKGSSHGYDVADPEQINSELGSESEFAELSHRLKDYGMGLLLDIVPNHMAASQENPWWMDVLGDGLESPYASSFDIDWHPRTAKSPGLQDGKVVLPVLGDMYGAILENQEIALRLEESGFWFLYGDLRFPLNPRTYIPVLELCLSRVQESFGSEHPAAERLKDLLSSIHGLAESREKGETRRASRQQIKARLWQSYRAEASLRDCLESCIHELNGTKGNARSFDRLDRLLSGQAYRLAFWRGASEEINYRRFFDINDLVGLRVELPEVFDARHATTLKLIEEAKITGLRIDYIDGLYDPHAYLERLNRACMRASGDGNRSPVPYLVVEKILGADEELPETWPVAGTTGYDFTNAVNALFVNAKGLEELENIYKQFTGAASSFADVSYQGNQTVMEQLFRGELRGLACRLGEAAARDRCARDIPMTELVRALKDVTACLPVYRTYVSGDAVSARDRVYLKQALKAARDRGASPFHTAALDFLERLLLLDVPPNQDDFRQECVRFLMQWQQFSGPVMAKGLEDTAFYIHNSLTSLNEVGGDPLRTQLPLGVHRFHTFNRARLAHWPATLNATSTHDTKRSEDVRARINVLSEIPREWRQRLDRWRQWNRHKKQTADGRETPAPMEEVFLYQTMLGAWPLDRDELEAFPERLTGCMIKAAKEAKLFTSWLDPRPDHEEGLRQFIRRILEKREDNRFLEDFLRFQQRIAFYGALNALSQVLLKIVSPGVPDFYQGTELWTFSMMDPDNRRPVDFSRRTHLLGELDVLEHADRGALIADLLRRWEDGRVKLYLTRKALEFRRSKSALFLEGEYIPLDVSGKRAANVCAFARRKGREWAIVAAPVMVTRLVGPNSMLTGRETWGASAILLPEEVPGELHNVFTAETVSVPPGKRRRTLPLREIFRAFPVALLGSGGNDSRRAGAARFGVSERRSRERGRSMGRKLLQARPGVAAVCV